MVRGVRPEAWWGQHWERCEVVRGHNQRCSLAGRYLEADKGKGKRIRLLSIAFHTLCCCWDACVPHDLAITDTTAWHGACSKSTNPDSASA